MNNSSHPSPLLRFVDQRLLCALCLLGVVSACGGAATQQPPVHRPGPDLSGYYATRTPGDLAYGRPQELASGTALERANLDEYLKPHTDQQPRARVASHHAVSAQLATAAPIAPVQAAAPQQAAPVQTAAPMEVASASTELDAQRYASRESQAKKQEQYRGGDVLVISATTLVIVLLIVLIIVLLT